jgi:hypothetical protein
MEKVCGVGEEQLQMGELLELLHKDTLISLIALPTQEEMVTQAK